MRASKRFEAFLALVLFHYYETHEDRQGSRDGAEVFQQLLEVYLSRLEHAEPFFI